MSYDFGGWKYEDTGFDPKAAFTGPDVISGYGTGVNKDTGVFNPPPTAAAAAKPGPTAEDTYWAQKAAAEQAAKDADTNNLIAVMTRYFNDNGMGAFSTAMDKYVRLGYTGDALMIVIGADPAYQAAWATRFVGNAERKANGLAELLPASYVELEQSYKSLMLAHGIPKTLFDEPSDFAALIGRDVSPTEANDRMIKAADYINYSGNDAVRTQLRDVYGMTDAEMISYMLDPKKTLDYLDSESRRNMNRANVGGAAVTQSVDLGAALRDEIAKMYDSTDSSYANTFASSTSKFATVGEESPLYVKLGALSDVSASSDELVREQFDLTGGVDVTAKKKVLASQERARFGGASGLGSTSLSAGRQAQ